MKNKKRHPKQRKIVPALTDLSIQDLFLPALQIIGRISLPPNKVRETIGSRKQLMRAYNLCDGKQMQIEIARQAKLDQGNFSRTLDRWEQHGIIFFIGNGGQRRPLHIYPIPDSPNHES